MGIRDWPESERPRERLLRHGATVLSDAELLAICLGSGTRGRSALDLARELLARFGGLRGLFAAEPGQLQAVPGLGPARSAGLAAILEIGRRHLREALVQRRTLRDPGDAAEYLQALLRDRRQEVFLCLFLDNRHRVIAQEELGRGTIDSAAVYPREVVRRTLEHGAAAVIFAHNHPSGVAEPSAADRQLTDRLRQALSLIDVRVLDHLVIGDGEPVSFARRGLL